ncbi:MAG: hypothetical protein R3Y24_11795 [Eubacteriales bacterium]
MNLKEFRNKIVELLVESDLEIREMQVEEERNQVVVSLKNDKNYIIQLQEIQKPMASTGGMTIRKEDIPEEIHEYLETHTRDEIMGDMRKMVASNPEYYKMQLMVFQLRDWGLLDDGEAKRISEGIEGHYGEMMGE